MSFFHFIKQNHRVGPVPDSPGQGPTFFVADKKSDGRPERIIGELVLASRLGRVHFHLPPIILVGRSGVGKSRLARRLAAYSAAAMAQISGAGSSDNRMLAGTARGWHSAQPTSLAV